MNKIALYILSIIVLIILTSSEGLACSCHPLSDQPIAKQVKEAKKKSNAVFTGEVVKITQNSEDFYIIVKLRVIDLWKGNLPKEITVLTGRDDGMCRYPFEIGKTYLVYAYNGIMYSSLRSLETTMCSRTKAFSDAKADINILGKSKNTQKN